jgi:hypothetical protein
MGKLNGHQKTHVLGINWATCSRFVDCSRFNNQLNLLGVNMIGIESRGNYMII